VRFEPAPDSGAPVAVGDFTRRVLMLDQAGIDDWKWTYVFYVKSYERIEDLAARVVKPDGTSADVGPDDILEVSTTRSELYNDGRAHVFDLRKTACAGCVVEYRYRERSTLHHSPFHWTFASDEPRLRSRLRVHLRAGQELGHVAVTGREAREVAPQVAAAADGGSVLTWEWHDTRVPPEEPWSPPDRVRAHVLRYALRRDPSGAAEPRLFTSWEDFGRWHYGLYEPRWAADASVRALAQSLVAGAAEDEARLRALYDHVRARVRYEAVEYGLGGWQPRAAAQTLSNGYGDCKDKATLLIALARSLDLDVWPVIIGTRNALPAVLPGPGLGTFNHAIAVADLGGRRVFLDPTCRDCPYGVLPAGDEDVPVVVIGPRGAEPARTPASRGEQNRIERRYEVDLDARGDGRVRFVAEAFGQSAAWLRGTLRNRNPEEIEDWLRTELHRIDVPGVERTAHRIEHLDDDAAPPRVEAELHVPALALAVPDGLVLRADRLLGPAYGLLPEPSRKHPILVEALWGHVSRAQIRVPSELVVAALPEGHEAAAAFGRCALSYASGDGGVEVTRRYTYDAAWTEASEARAVADLVRGCRTAEARGIVLTRRAAGAAGDAR
jgi:transglutaminase-like putative cysteine protease